VLDQVLADILADRAGQALAADEGWVADYGVEAATAHDLGELQCPLPSHWRDQGGLVVPGVILDAGQRHQVRCPAGEHVRVTTCHIAPRHVGRYPLAVSHRDQLSRRRDGDLLIVRCEDAGHGGILAWRGLRITHPSGGRPGGMVG